MTATIHSLPSAEDTVAGTLEWARDQDFEAVAIIGWAKDERAYFGFSRLNSLYDKLGILEYARMRLWNDLSRQINDTV